MCHFPHKNTKLTHLLIFYPLCLTPLHLVAASITTEQEQQNEESDINDDIEDDDSDAVTPIEIGPAGNIRMESPYRTQAEEKSPVHIHAMWESRYVTEGRDNLSGNSLISFSTDHSYNNFTFAPWIAGSSYTEYRELNLNLVYGIELNEQIESYITYTYLRSDSSDEDTSDNELGIELGYLGFKHIQIIANWYYSLEAEGAYFELVLRNEKPIGQNLTLSTSLSTGLNGGYVSDGHRGLDHTHVRINLAYHPWAELDLFSYLSYSQSIQRDAVKYSDDADLSDYAWGGIGATYRF